MLLCSRQWNQPHSYVYKVSQKWSQWTFEYKLRNSNSRPLNKSKEARSEMDIAGQYDQINLAVMEKINEIYFTKAIMRYRN